MDKQLRFASYIRKSTEEEERQVLSIESQKQKIETIFKDMQVLYEFRESKSAFDPNKRPEFDKMLAHLDDGKIDGIVAWHPDRLSRNAVDAAAISHRVTRGVIKDLKFANYSFDNSPEGMMMLQMTMSQSQYFSAKLSKDIKRGNERKREVGQLTGRAPEGYLNHRTALSGRGEATVIADPERFPLLRKAFDLFLTGEYSVPSIHSIMNNEWGYRTMKRNKSGGGGISRTVLYNTFQNVRYAGLIPDPNDPEHYYPASYPAMITLDEYNKVQKLLGRRGLPRMANKKEFALRGFIHCGDCGCAITAQTKIKKLANGGERSHTYYHCTGKRKGCAQKSNYISEDALYDQLLELLDNYELSAEMNEWAMGAIREMAEEEAKSRDGVQMSQHKAISDTQTQLDKLLDMATRGLIDDDVYMNKSSVLKAQLVALQDEQADTAHRVKNWYEILTDTVAKLTNATVQFKSGGMSEKRDILLAIGQNPLLMDKSLAITPNEWLIPVANAAKDIREQIEVVRTMPQQIQKASEEALMSKWCRV